MKYIAMKYLVIFLSLLSLTTQAQSGLYDQDLLSPAFHAGRRQALRDKMSDNSAALVFAAPERNRANDVDFVYHQDPNFYYLSGLNEPNAVLVVFKTPQTIKGQQTNELLLVERVDPQQLMWTGKRTTKEQAQSKLGVKMALYTDEFLLSELPYSTYTKVYHSYFYDDVRNSLGDKHELADLIKLFKEQTASLKNLEPTGFFKLMAQLRQIKTPEEMVLLRKAIDISCKSHEELMRRLVSSSAEYQAQAIVEYGFKYNGAEDVGYPSIVGAGENGCVAHYISNRKQFTKTDMLVVDAGAEYHGYTADITRSLPVNGRFSKEQALIYNLVLKAQEAGIKACRKGNGFYATHEATSYIIKKGLLELGIIKNESEYQTYFFHGTSHYLGLDVHDAGTYGKLEPNEVITVEPGIYIPEGSDCDPKWWNIGVRIEDDVLITDGDPEVLSSKLPRTIAEIEALMNSVR